MVRTRHSLPSTAPAEEEEETPAPTSQGNRKLKNALKKLKVDGTKALVGEKAAHEEEELETYHHRGAVYVKTKNTPQAWVDNQPKRWKKRESGGSEAPEDLEEEDEDDGGVKIGVEQDSFTPSVVGKKRSAVSLDGAEDEENEEPTPKRAKRSVPEKFYGRQKRKSSSSTNSSTKKRRKTSGAKEVDNDEPEVERDFALSGGHEKQSCIEASRARAAAQGYAVEPIPEQVLLGGSASGENTKGLERKVVKDLVQLASVNSKIDRLKRRFAVSKELIARRQKRSGAAGLSSELRNAIASEPPASVFASSKYQTLRATTDSPQAARLRPGIQEFTPPSNASQFSYEDEEDEYEEDEDEIPRLGSPDTTASSNMEIITDRRHDSATSITPPTIYKNRALINTTHNAKNGITDPPALQLPGKNKGGQRLRWSLGSQVTNDERAESQIHFARLDGESKSARRRRVRREIRVTRGWDALKEGGDADDDDDVDE